MARITSQAKGGYYPTPPEEMELICQRLVPAQGLLNILDPCTGKGKALKQAAEHFVSAGAEALSFGVELEESRYKRAKTLLHKTVHGGYEELRASNNAFSLLFLNPPYDWGPNGQRLEQVFLTDLTAPGKYLQQGGILVFIIPARTLSYVANLISIRFSDVKVYRFTDKNYPVFKQVVLFGKRQQGRGDPELRKQIRDRLSLMAEDQSIIPVIDTQDGWMIPVPSSNKEVELFRGQNLDPEEVAKDLESINWSKIEQKVLVEDGTQSALETPLLPLKLAHIASYMSANCLSGYAGNHYRNGITKQIAERQNTSDEKNYTEIETIRHISVIQIFSKDGLFRLSTEGEDV